MFWQAFLYAFLSIKLWIHVGEELACLPACLPASHGPPKPALSYLEERFGTQPFHRPTPLHRWHFGAPVRSRSTRASGILWTRGTRLQQAFEESKGCEKTEGKERKGKEKKLKESEAQCYSATVLQCYTSRISQWGVHGLKLNVQHRERNC